MGRSLHYSGIVIITGVVMMISMLLFSNISFTGYVTNEQNIQNLYQKLADNAKKEQDVFTQMAQTAAERQEILKQLATQPIVETNCLSNLY